MKRKRETAKVRAFRARYGPAALVTGAAQGIGRAFAESLAARGLAVFMVDVQAEAVERAAAEVARDYAGKAIPIVADLAERSFLAQILAGLEAAPGAGEENEIGLVICNAAIGLEGPFLSESLELLHRAIEVNCHATMTLTHHFGKSLVARGRGDSC